MQCNDIYICWCKLLQVGGPSKCDDHPLRCWLLMTIHIRYVHDIWLHAFSLGLSFVNMTLTYAFAYAFLYTTNLLMKYDQVQVQLKLAWGLLEHLEPPLLVNKIITRFECRSNHSNWVRFSNRQFIIMRELNGEQGCCCGSTVLP